MALQLYIYAYDKDIKKDVNIKVQKQHVRNQFQGQMALSASK